MRDQDTEQLEKLISMSFYHRWGFKRFFLNNDQIMFKELCSELPNILNFIIIDNDDIKLYEAIESYSENVFNLNNKSDTPKYFKLIEEAIDIINKILAEKNSSLEKYKNDLTEITKKLSSEQDKNNIEIIQDTIDLVSIALSKETIIKTAQKYIKSNDYKSLKKILSENKKRIEEELKKSKDNIEDNNLNIVATLTLYIIYIFIFVSTAPGIQLSLFGAMLLGGSTAGNIIFGAIASAITTFIAITISKVRNKIYPNTLFNMLFLCAIFAYFMINSTLIWISSQVIFALLFTSIAYNIINIIELLIRYIVSSKIFICLSFYKDVLREVLLMVVLLPIGDIISHNFMNEKELHIFTIICNSYCLAIPFTFYTVRLLAHIIVVKFIYIYIIWILYSCIFSFMRLSPNIKTPRFYNNIINYLSQILESICSNTIRCFDHSELIASLIKNIFNQYREIIPALPKISTSNKYLNYAIDNIIFMVQSVIDLVLFPVFTILYPAYTAIKVISHNTLETLHNHPFIATAFFIATSVVSAVFASPIQLFILGTVVMNGYPVMNILFGTMSGILSTTFGTNAYVVINTAAIPYISSSLKGAKETFNSFCENYIPCFSNNSKDAPFTK